jgi:hypothetical protein
VFFLAEVGAESELEIYEWWRVLVGNVDGCGWQLEVEEGKAVRIAEPELIW